MSFFIVIKFSSCFCRLVHGILVEKSIRTMIPFLMIIVAMTITLGVSLQSVQGVNIVLGIMGCNSSASSFFNFFKYSRLGAAVPLAIADAITKNVLSSNYTISYVMQPSQCDQKIALDSLVMLRSVYQAAGVIGPDCSPPTLSSGLLASLWNIPMVGYATQSPDIADKTIYNTIVRSNPTYSYFSAPVKSLLIRYKWTNVGLLIEEPIASQHYLKPAFINLFTSYNITVNLTGVDRYNLQTAINAVKLLATACRGLSVCVYMCEFKCECVHARASVCVFVYSWCVKMRNVCVSRCVCECVWVRIIMNAHARMLTSLVLHLINFFLQISNSKFKYHCFVIQSILYNYSYMRIWILLLSSLLLSCNIYCIIITTCSNIIWTIIYYNKT